MNRSLEHIREEVLRQDGSRFPGRSVVEQYLKSGFEADKGDFLDDLIEIEKASFIMLCEQDILPVDQRLSIRYVLTSLNPQSLRDRAYDAAQGEDMYFVLETHLINAAGNCAANLHLGRSRNDLVRTASKMGIRRNLSYVIDALLQFAEVLLAFARHHQKTLCLEYTHTQQAQPATVGHYIAGLLQSMLRNLRRLEVAYSLEQTCPLGAGALTTSGFPINRQRLAGLLGFDAVAENSYDAISSCDFLCEPAAALAVLMVDLGRFMQHLHVWAAAEYGYLQMGNAYTGISSMMPQKRNPCVLERMRATASLVLGKCHACMIAQHNTEWEGNLEIATTPSLINESLKQSRDLLYLLRNQMATLALDEALLNKRTMESYAVMTELADALVRNTGVDYRTAHHIVSALVDECTSQRLLVSEITAEHIARHFRAVTCRDINIPAEILLQSLDARRCVETRAVCGGPAAEALDAALDKLEHRLDKAVSRQARRVQRIRDSHVKLEQCLQTCVNLHSPTQ